MPHHLAKGSKCPPSVTDKIRLYSNKFCPYSERIHLVLDAKEIPHDVVYICLNNLPEWFVKKNPSGKVSAIELETDDVLYESIIIAQYLDEMYSNKKLLPKDCLEKAKDLLFIEYFNDVIAAMNGILLSFGRHPKEQEETMRQGLQKFESELQRRGNFYGGVKPGLVDYFLWPWVERADLIKLFSTRIALRKENFKNIVQWHQKMMENQAVKKSFLDIETHTTFFQTYCSGVPQYDIA